MRRERADIEPARNFCQMILEAIVRDVVKHTGSIERFLIFDIMI